MRPGLAAKALSQNVWYGGCTEIAQPVVRNLLQRVALSQNSSFTGADNPENITAEPGIVLLFFFRFRQILSADFVF